MTNPPTKKAGWALNEHLDAWGASRTFYYSLPPEKRPKSLYIRAKLVITESPEDYLARMAAEQKSAAA